MDRSPLDDIIKGYGTPLKLYVPSAPSVKKRAISFRRDVNNAHGTVPNTNGKYNLIAIAPNHLIFPFVLEKSA